MSGACRRTDTHFNGSDVCGCSACPHAVSGPAVTGSPDTWANGLEAFRGNGRDTGVHCCCCGANIWGSDECSSDVIVNGDGWVRLGDQNWCCGGVGNMITASDDVIIN